MSPMSPEGGRVPVEIMRAEEERLRSKKDETKDADKGRQVESTIAFNIDREVDGLMESLPAYIRPEFDQGRADKGEDQYSYNFENEVFDTPEGKVRLSFYHQPAGKEKAGETSVQFKGPKGVGHFRIEKNRITQCSARFGPENPDNYPRPAGDKEEDDEKQRASTAGLVWNQAKPFVEKKIKSEAEELSQAA